MALFLSSSPTVWELPLPPPSFPTAITSGGAACLSSAGLVVPNGISASSVPAFEEILSPDSQSSHSKLSTMAEIEQALEHVHAAAASARMEINAEREAISAEGSRHRASLAALRGRLVEVERRRAAQAVLTEEKEDGLKNEFAEAEYEAAKLLKELVSSKRRAQEGNIEFAIEARCASEAAALHDELEAQNKMIAEAQQELLEAQRGRFSSAVVSGRTRIADDSRAIHARQRAEHEGRSLRSEIVSVQREFEAMQAGCEAREYHCELLADEIGAIRSDLSTFAHDKQFLHIGSANISLPSTKTVDLSNALSDKTVASHSSDQAVESSTWEAAELKVANAELRRELGATEAEAAAREAALQSRKAELTANALAGAPAVNCHPSLTGTSFRQPSRVVAATGSTLASHSCASTSDRFSPALAKSTEGQKPISTPPMQRRGNTTPDDTCRTGSPWFSASPESRLTAFELSVLGTTLDLSTSSASSLPQRYLDQSRSSLLAVDAVSKCTACGGSMDSHGLGNSSDSLRPTSSALVRLKTEASELFQERKGLQEMLKEVDEALVLQNTKVAAASCSTQQATELFEQETCSLRHAHTVLEATLAKIREGSVSVVSSPSTPLGSHSGCSRSNQLSSDGQQDANAIAAPFLDSLGGSRTPVQGPETSGSFAPHELGSTRRVLEVALGERSFGSADGMRVRRLDRGPAWMNKGNEVVRLSGESDKGDGDRSNMMKDSWSSNRFEVRDSHGDLHQRIAKLQCELDEAKQLQSASSEALLNCQSQLEMEIASRASLEAQKADAEISVSEAPVVQHLQKVVSDMESKAVEDAQRAKELEHEWGERLEMSRARVRDTTEEAASYKTFLSTSSEEADSYKTSLKTSREEVASLAEELASERLALTSMRQTECDQQEKVASLLEELESERLALTSLRQTERIQHQRAEQEMQSLRESERLAVSETAACKQNLQALADELAAASEARRTVESLAVQTEPLNEACGQTAGQYKVGTNIAENEMKANLTSAVMKAKDRRIAPMRVKDQSSTSMRAARRILDSSSSRGSLAEGATLADEASKPSNVDLALATSISSRLRAGPCASSRSSSEDVGANAPSATFATEELRSHAADLKRRLASRVCEAAASRRPHSLAISSVVADSNPPSHKALGRSSIDAAPEVASTIARRRTVSTGTSSPAALMASGRRALLSATRPKSLGGAPGVAPSPPSSPESSLERLVMKSNPMLQRMRGGR